MTKKEREYLQKQIQDNKEKIRQVEKGELWTDIYNTEELRIAFIQGLYYANDIFDKFING